MDEPQYINTRRAAEITGYSIGALANMRAKGEGPNWLKPKGRVRYAMDEIRRWMEQG